MTDSPNDIEEFNDKCMIIKIKPATIRGRKNDVYDAVRWAWKANLKRAERADYVLAVETGTGGRIIGVFKPEKWYKATAENDKRYGHFLNEGGSEETEKRIAFQGERADKNAMNRYLNKFLPLEFRTSQNPVRYTY
jgi:hypothetical protein